MNYIEKLNTATSIPNTSLRTSSKTKRDIFKKGFSLLDFRDMINQDGNTDLNNNEFKGFLIEEFGDSISFCDPGRKNESLFAFSSSIEVQDITHNQPNIDVVKPAASEIRKP